MPTAWVLWKKDRVVRCQKLSCPQTRRECDIDRDNMRQILVKRKMTSSAVGRSL